MSFKDDISEAKSKELNYFHKANEDFADDIIESNTECWNCHQDIPMGKKYCKLHCGHHAEDFDDFTGKCKGCGTSLNVNMMMTMPSAEAKATEAKIERSDGSMTIDGKQVIKIWESMQGWYWYAVEDQGEYTGVGADGNDIQAHAWFGYVQADFNEWGTFDSKELERAGVWTVPKSNWGWTGKMEESKASEKEDPITGYGLGNKGLLCDECGMIITRDEWNNHLKEHGITGDINESKASEGHIWGDWFSDNFKEVYTMDQSGTYRCKHCDAWFDMYMHSQEVAKYHLAGHGILTESKASEDRDWDGRSDLEKLERDQELSKQFWNKSSTLNEIPDSYHKESVASEVDQEIITRLEQGRAMFEADVDTSLWDMAHGIFLEFKLSSMDEAVKITKDWYFSTTDTGYYKESKASEARKLNARQKKLIEEWVGSMSSPPMMITSDDLPYSLLSELRGINDFDGFDSAIMRYASDLGNKQSMQGSNPYMHSSNYGSFESKAGEGKWLEAGRKESAMLYDVKNSALMGDFEPFINLVKQGGGDWSYFEQNPNKEEILQQIDMELENLKMSQVDRGNWDALGMHQESKASEYTLEDLERVGIDWDNSSVVERKQIIIDTHNGYTEGHDDNIVKNWNELSNHTRTIITQGKSNESVWDSDIPQTDEDIDWTKDKPEGDIPFYCPLCHMTIEEIATYDGVFQHNKQLHNMSDENAEILAKGFTYSNSPPTSFESKASETNYFHSLDASAEDILNRWLENQNESVTGEELPDHLWDEIEKTDGGSRLDSDDIQNYIDDYFNTDYDGESKADESEDVFMYDGTGDSDGVGYWWDFELPVDEMKHEQLSSILGIDINTAWGFMTPAEQDRVRNYKLNRSMTNEAQLMKEINDGWEFSVIDHGYGGGNMGNSPDVGLLEVGIFAPDTGDINGQKSAVQGYMTQADVDGLLSTFRTDPAVAFRSIGGEWTFAGQQGLEYQSDTARDD